MGHQCQWGRHLTCRRRASRRRGATTLRRAYNDPAGPVQPGSGGNAAYAAASSRGGGAVRIDAKGQLAVNGTITANGKDYVNTHGSGGSGGSLWINCRTLAGTATGLLSVNGGARILLRRLLGVCRSHRAELQHERPGGAAASPVPPVRFSGRPGGG